MLVSGAHHIGQNIYHVEWCPKYRYKMFTKDKNKKLCEEILRETAKRHNIQILEINILPDHIHLAISIPPTMSIARAFQLLKGGSAHELFKKEPKFRLRYPKGHFWSPGKFFRTIGDIDLETTTHYIRNQHNINQATLQHFHN